MGNNSFIGNASSYFEKLMKQTYVSKSDILSLKNQFKQLKKSGNSNEKFNNILNRITNIANEAEGKNSPEILTTVYIDFKKLTKTKLTELESSQSNQEASPGMFRACVMIDSCMYQIGEDTPDRNTAFGYCREYISDAQPVQIFDDAGKAQIIDGQLKKEYKMTRIPC